MFADRSRAPSRREGTTTASFVRETIAWSFAPSGQSTSGGNAAAPACTCGCGQDAGTAGIFQTSPCLHGAPNTVGRARNDCTAARCLEGSCTASNGPGTHAGGSIAFSTRLKTRVPTWLKFCAAQHIFVVGLQRLF